VDLKVQFEQQHDKNCPVQFEGFTKPLRKKICLNINFKTDKEDISCDDIAFLSEIIADFRFWQSATEIPRK
jgi:hypothetical protein